MGYAKIAKAILDQDVASADRAMARHFAGTRKTMAEIPLDSFPMLDPT